MMSGGESHKKIDLSGNPILRHYYTNKVISGNNAVEWYVSHPKILKTILKDSEVFCVLGLYKSFAETPKVKITIKTLCLYWELDRIGRLLQINSLVVIEV